MYTVLSRVCSLASGAFALSRAPGAWIPLTPLLSLSEYSVVTGDLVLALPRIDPNITND